MAMWRNFCSFSRSPFSSSLVKSKLTDHRQKVCVALGSLWDRSICTEPSVIGHHSSDRSLSSSSKKLNWMNCQCRNEYMRKATENRSLPKPQKIFSRFLRNNSDFVNTVTVSNTHRLIECSCASVEKHVHTGDFQVIERFVGSEEQDVLLEEIERHFKGARYEYDHWDDAIHGYRETEKSSWSEETQNILQRVRDQAFQSGAAQLPLVHVLDLAEDGYIKPHVDSVKFCGPTIAGLSLVSSCVVKLINERDKTQWLKALLPAGSLYIMRNAIRYDYTHEILKDEESICRGERIRRGRRVSVMFRDHPTEMDSQE